MELPDLPAVKKPEKHSATLSLTDTKPLVTRFGHAMKQNRSLISAIQWSMVSLYFFLLFAPLFFPESKSSPSIVFWSNLRILAVFIFWGIGWPLIILTTMVFGRIWCGILCPEGTLTETISHYGQHRSIPRWIRWESWPCMTFMIYTTAIIFSGAAYSHTATFTLLFLLTLFAMLTGFLYGRSKRIWCLYLCPSNAVFSFLARLSPFYFYVDKQKWDQYKGPAEQINCAPLINIKRMKSNSACHACGRCSGYRNAVELATRMPGREILSEESKSTTTTQALTLLLGLAGIGTMTLLWAKKPFPLNASFDSTYAIVLLIVSIVLLQGSMLWILMWLSCKMSNTLKLSWQQLALGIIPLAGTGLFLGLTISVFSFFQIASWGMLCIFVLQLIFLLIAFFFSFWLGWQLIMRRVNWRNTFALLVYGITLGFLTVLWTICLYP